MDSDANTYMSHLEINLQTEHLSHLQSPLAVGWL